MSKYEEFPPENLGIPGLERAIKESLGADYAALYEKQMAALKMLALGFPLMQWAVDANAFLEHMAKGIISGDTDAEKLANELAEVLKDFPTPPDPASYAEYGKEA